MKRIIIKSMHLVNFKGVRDLSIDFNDTVTNIYGRNGAGKTTVFDAFVWLLFGKDAQDRKDYEIKTRVNGQELHDVECSVAGEFIRDLAELTKKKPMSVWCWAKGTRRPDHCTQEAIAKHLGMNREDLWPESKDTEKQS